MESSTNYGIMTHEHKRQRRKSSRPVAYIGITLAVLAIANIIKSSPNLDNQPRSLRPNAYYVVGREEASLLFRGDERSAFPSWAIVTQCSVYHTDCPNHLKFQEYPFPSVTMTALTTKTNADEWI